MQVVHALKKGSYHFYMVQTPFLAPLMLHLATQQNSSTGSVAGAEKSAFAWVPLKALLECVAASAPRYVLQAAAHVCGGYGTPPPIEGGRHRFQVGHPRPAGRAAALGCSSCQLRAEHAASPSSLALPLQLHPSFANSVRQAQRCGLQELLARAEELPLPPPPPLVLLPAAEQVEAAHGQAAAVAAAAAFQAAAVAAAVGVEGGCCSEEGEAAGLGLEPEDSGGYGYGTALGIEHSLGYWLARADIAAALRGDPPAAAAAAAAALSPSLQPAPIPHPAQQQQQQPQRCQQHAAPADNSQPQSPMRSGLAAAGRWGHTTVPSTTPAQSGSSVAHPSSSIDTASSLRESRQAAAAAAVGEVVQTIEENSRRPRQRPSRKQRQKLRRQRQKQEQAIAAAAALGSPDAAKRQQQKQQPSNPPWEQAGEEDEAQFQPHVRRCKRLRLQVSAS